MFVIYDPATGEIRSTISGPDEDYGQLLTEKGDIWLFAPEVLSLDPRVSYVNHETRSIADKSAMPIVLDRSRFTAGNDEGAVLSGIPVGARISVICNDAVQYSGVADDPELRLTSPVAATYLLTVEAPRFLPWHAEVVAE